MWGFWEWGDAVGMVALRPGAQDPMAWFWDFRSAIPRRQGQGTSIGTGRGSSWVARPTCPYPFQPQHQTFPESLLAQT